ncbi:hypothetical protein F4801DRAFT_548993 [Xylaria longipes]|nr:hypothetical protein F4801DRAFT_548993 [Xylaria longipes]
MPWERKVMRMGQITTWLHRCVHEHGKACRSSWTSPWVMSRMLHRHRRKSRSYSSIPQI